MSEPSEKGWLDWLLELLFGQAVAAETEKNLRAAASAPDALTILGTAMVDLPTFGENIAEEERRQRAAIVAFARAQLGEPYQFGAEGPADQDLDRWDCAELVEHAYAHGGVPIVDGSLNQRAACQRVREPQPADLACYNADANGVGHVELYAGDGVVIGARSKKRGGVQVGAVVELARAEVEAHPRFAGWFRHPDFARPKEDRA